MENNLKALTILLRASKSSELVLKKDIKNYNLNPAEFGVLEFLYHKGPQPMNKLCDKLLMANSSMTYVVDKLIKRGYVQRYVCIEDKRNIYVRLTEEGTIYIKEIFPRHESVIDEIFSVLSEEEIIKLKEVLKKIGTHADNINYGNRGDKYEKREKQQNKKLHKRNNEVHS